MKNCTHKILVVLKNQFLSEQSMEQEIECLNWILAHTDTPAQFCKSHELVNRNRITNIPGKILKETSSRRLRSFRFLINKN